MTTRLTAPPRRHPRGNPCSGGQCGIAGIGRYLTGSGEAGTFVYLSVGRVGAGGPYGPDY